MCPKSWGDFSVSEKQKEIKVKVTLSSESHLWGLQVQLCVCQRDCADPWAGRALTSAAPKLRDLSRSFCADGGSVMSCDCCGVTARTEGILWPQWLGWVALFQTFAFVWQPKGLHSWFSCFQDFLIMFVHHLATIGLITFSYMNNMVRVGTLVLCLHDASDFLLEVNSL